MASGVTLQKMDIDEILRRETDCLAALRAFAVRPADDAGSKAKSRQGSFGVDPVEIERLAGLARTVQTETDARAFLKKHFEPLHIAARGQATAFFEPRLCASRKCHGAFNVPLLARPPELIRRKSRQTGDTATGYGVADRSGHLHPLHDRRAIEQGALSDRQLEIAWLDDAVEAFFLHVQGAGLIDFDDGTQSRVTFDGKCGHTFTGIGRILVRTGEIAQSRISMQSIMRWLRADPCRARRMMWRNRSYIFFREGGDPTATGPVAAAKLPMHPMRSIAVDLQWHTLRALYFLTMENLGGTRFEAFVTAHDTGSAIRGPARIDLFCGTGDQAGAQAGGVNSACDLVLLKPKPISG